MRCELIPNQVLWKMTPNNLFKINIRDWESLLECARKMESWKMNGWDAGRKLEKAAELGGNSRARLVQCISISRHV